jgi:hypothetical protein
VPGGILIGDVVRYDTLSRLLLGPFLARIAADVAAVARDGRRFTGGSRGNTGGAADAFACLDAGG